MQKKRLTDKDINLMNITEVVKILDTLSDKIRGNEVNFYMVNTFMKLVGKVSSFYLGD